MGGLNPSFAPLWPLCVVVAAFLLFRAETGAKLQAHRSRPEKKPYFLVRSKRVTIEDTGPELHLALRELPSIGPADCTRRLRASASEFFGFRFFDGIGRWLPLGPGPCASGWPSVLPDCAWKLICAVIESMVLRLFEEVAVHATARDNAGASRGCKLVGRHDGTVGI